MPRVLSAPLALLAVAAAPAPPDAARPDAVRPTWELRPDEAAMAKLYPEKASRAVQSGSAVLGCALDGQGLLQDCQVLREEPAGWGFGDAALKASRYFKMKPATPDGASVAGRRILLPIGWTATFRAPPARGLGEPAYIMRTKDKDRYTREEMAAAGGSIRYATCPRGPLNGCISMPLAWAEKPGAAEPASLSGAVAVVCKVEAGGSLGRCETRPLSIGASPAAAVALAHRFRAPVESQGRPTEGGWAAMVLGARP